MTKDIVLLDLFSGIGGFNKATQLRLLSLKRSGNDF
jgi:site-specific DNA-cytosine methylase